MKKILLCLAAMAAGQHIVHAQANFIPGVVITQQHDSLRGLINVKNWQTNPAEIDFKSDNNAASHIYKATEINGFIIPEKNAVFLSKHLNADVTYYETSTISDQPRIVEYLDTIAFLERLVPGQYPLYAYTDIHHRDHYLYEAPGVPMTELVYVKTIVSTSEGDGFYERKTYQEQLDTLFKDNPKLANQNRFLKYYESSLVKAFVAYNKFKDPSAAAMVVVGKKVRNPVWFGVIAGVSFNSYKFSGSNKLVGGDYTSSVNPTVGVFVDIPFNGASRKFSLYNEILYKTVNTSAVLHGPVYNNYENDEVKFGFAYAQINIMAQYTYPKGNIRPFVHIGMGNAIVVSTSDNDYYAVSSKSHSIAINGIRKHEESAIAGVGVRASRFQVEARYATSTGWVPFSTSRVGVHSLQIIAGVRF